MSGIGTGFDPLAIAAPDLYAKQIGIARRQALGQALLQGATGDPGRAAFGGLRNAGNALMGAFLLRGADKDMAGLYSPLGGETGGIPTGQITNSTQAIGANQAPAVPQAQLNGSLDPEGNPVGSYMSAPGPAPMQPQAMPQMQPQPQAQPRTIPEALAQMIVPIPGLSKQASLQFYMANPKGYYEALAAANVPTPEQRDYQAAYPNDPNAVRQGLQGLLTHNRTINFRGGNFGFDPGTGTGFGIPNAEGIAPVMGPNGQMGMQLVPGAQPSLAGSNFATSLGRGAVTPATGYGPDNLPVPSNQAVMSGNGPAAAQMIPGYGAAPQGSNLDANNPLNMQPGGQQARYATPTAGFGTAWDNLSAYAKRGITSVAGILNTWAPYQDQSGRVINPATPQNIARISQQLGVNPNQPLPLQDPNVKGRLIDLMRPTETGNRYAPPQGPALRPELPAGQGAYMQGQAKDASDRHDATVAAAAESPMRINVLDNIINLSQQGVATGPSQEWQTTALGYLANTPLLSRVLGGAKDNVAKFQELQKFTYQNAIRNWQAAGGTGTDAQMESMAHANPNDHLFPAALQQIAKWGKASEIALQGKANAQDRYLQLNGNTPQAQIQFESAWRNAFDPKVFQYGLMNQPEKQAFARTLGTPQAAQAFMEKQARLKELGALP